MVFIKTKPLGELMARDGEVMASDSTPRSEAAWTWLGNEASTPEGRRRRKNKIKQPMMKKLYLLVIKAVMKKNVGEEEKVEQLVVACMEGH